MLGGASTATDPDPGQVLTFSLLAPPAHGAVDLSPERRVPVPVASGLRGRRHVHLRGLRQRVATRCATTALVTINVRPVATDDLAETFEAVPVTVPVVANDTDGAPLDATAVTAADERDGRPRPRDRRRDRTRPPQASRASTRSRTGSARRREPTFCDTAVVTVTVVARNDPPTIEPLLLVTTTGVAVTGDLVVDDPNGDTVTTFSGIPPRTGTELVEPDGSTTLLAEPGVRRP